LPCARYICHGWLVTLAILRIITRFRLFKRRVTGLNGIELGNNFIFSPIVHCRFVKGSFGAIVVVNTLESFPKRCRIFPETHVRGTKRKRSNSYSEHPSSEISPTCTICLSYNSILFMDFINKNEMVVVEQPWLNVVATFPGALHRKVYGT
jgi:hypothetical protein